MQAQERRAGWYRGTAAVALAVRTIPWWVPRAGPLACAAANDHGVRQTVQVQGVTKVAFGCGQGGISLPIGSALSWIRGTECVPFQVGLVGYHAACFGLLRR